MRNFLKGVFFAYLVAKFTRPVRRGVSAGLAEALDNGSIKLIFTEAIAKTITKIVDGAIYGDKKGEGDKPSSPESGVQQKGPNPWPAGAVRDVALTYTQVRFQSEQDTLDVLDVLRLKVKDRGFATVMDFFDAVGVPGAHADLWWGWDNLENATTVSMPDGQWRLDLPKVARLSPIRPA